jgi:hypothetical protein
MTLRAAATPGEGVKGKKRWVSSCRWRGKVRVAKAAKRLSAPAKFLPSIFSHKSKKVGKA